MLPEEPEAPLAPERADDAFGIDCREALPDFAGLDGLGCLAGLGARWTRGAFWREDERDDLPEGASARLVGLRLAP